MKGRFEELLESLSYEDLLDLKQDIDRQGIQTKKAVEEKIKKKMREFDKTCSVCLSELRFYNSSNYSLMFGPDDFKKKASFCGLDCLQYFINHLNALKQGNRKDASQKGDPKVMDAQ
ncbi:MAG TPA: hypothetical protein VJB12_04290 [Candidatus Nanoarchaeia archaeon]|nr:hypothetical protein [Candidatus Nanoarchaeia archaeon]